MKGLSRVLCAVDIDERAAFAEALALARSHSADMIIVYAVPLNQSFNTGATERVAYLLSLRAAAEAAGVDVRVDVQQGEPSEIILLHALARQPDLIVLSAAHGGGANGVRVGSVVEDVIRGASCPTLVVRRDQKSSASGPLRNALCAVDFSPASEAAITYAQLLTAGPERRLTLLHVVPGNNRHVAAAALQRLQALIPPHTDGTVFTRVAVGSVGPEILRAERATQTDVVVVGTQSRSRLGRRMFGVIGQLLKEAPCPVLAVPARAAGSRERGEWRQAA